MNKQQFLVEINARLGKLKVQERLDIQRDFEEYFEDGIREGKTEEEIVAAFGQMDELVDALLEAYTEEDFVETAMYSLEKTTQHQFSKVEIKSNVSDCIIEPSPDNEPHILQSNESTENTVKMTIENDLLKITIKYNKMKVFIFGFNFRKNSKERIRIQLPVHVYEAVRVKNSVGNITLVDLQSKELHVRNEIGRIRLENIISTSLDVKNETGTTEIENVCTTSGKIHSELGKLHILNSKAEQWNLKSEAGALVVEHTSGKIKARAEVGSITINQKAIIEDYNLKSEMGGISIQTDIPIINAEIEVKKEFGSAKIYNEKTTYYSHGTKAVQMKIKTELGRVQIGLNNASY